MRHTKASRISASELAIFRRVLVAGCPLTWSYFLRRYPLRMRTGVPTIGSNVLPLTSGGSAILIWVRVLALARLSFGGFGLWSEDGQRIPVSWVDLCPDHNAYCVHNYVHGHLKIEPDSSLNALKLSLLVLQKSEMRRGDHFEGFLLGITPAQYTIAPGMSRNAFLVWEDAFGDEYPVPIQLVG